MTSGKRAQTAHQASDHTSSGHNLLSDPIPKLLRNVGVPAAMSYLISILNNVVDVWFAGNWSVAAQAALGVSFPLFFLIIAVSAGLGQAAGALVAYRLGAGQIHEAKTYVAQGTLCAIFAGLVVGGLGFGICGIALTAMGVEGETYLYAKGYMEVMFATAASVSLISISSGFLNAQGLTTLMRNTTILGLIVNIALNPLLMYGLGPLPGFGPVGLAWATFGANLVIIATQGAAIFRGVSAPTERCFWRPKRDALIRYGSQALPPSLHLLMIGILFFLLNTFFAGIALWYCWHAVRHAINDLKKHHTD